MRASRHRWFHMMECVKGSDVLITHAWGRGYVICGLVVAQEVDNFAQTSGVSILRIVQLSQNMPADSLPSAWVLKDSSKRPILYARNLSWSYHPFHFEGRYNRFSFLSTLRVRASQALSLKKNKTGGSIMVFRLQICSFAQHIIPVMIKAPLPLSR